jgi:hypothetical protein
MKGDFHGQIVQASRVLIGNQKEVIKDGLWKFREHVFEGRVGKHEIYWGCHSCNLEPGHSTKYCICSCGATPERYSIFWGRDFKGFTAREMKARMDGLNREDRLNMTIVVGDMKGALVNGKYQRSRRPNIRRTKRKSSRGKKTIHSG